MGAPNRMGMVPHLRFTPSLESSIKGIYASTDRALLLLSDRGNSSHIKLTVFFVGFFLGPDHKFT